MGSQSIKISSRVYLASMRLYAWFCRFLSPASGLMTLSVNRFTNYAFARIPEIVHTSFIDGVPIDVNVKDYDGRRLFLFGTNEPKVASVAQSLLRSGDVFLDIGANYSSIGVSVRDIVGISGAVHLFEPQPELCNRVAEAIKAGNMTNVQLHRIALFDCDGMMELSSPTGHSGKATLISELANSHWSQNSVEVKDIASHAPPLIAGRSFGVKLDIEGAEIHILPWLVQQQALRFVIVEMNHNQENIWKILIENGFIFFCLSRRLFKHEVCYIEHFEESCEFEDVVAIRSEYDPSLVPECVSTRLLAKYLS